MMDCVHRDYEMQTSMDSLVHESKDRYWDTWLGERNKMNTPERELIYKNKLSQIQDTCKAYIINAASIFNDADTTKTKLTSIGFK